MADQITTAEAEQAFIDSLADDSVPAEAQPENKPESTAPSPETATPDSEGTTPEPPAQEDSFTRTDLDALLDGITDPAAQEAITRAYKGFQGDYTKSKQELAEQRKQLEGIDDPAAAREALEFYQNLQSDPAFALEVHEYLTNAFEQMGLTPKQAAEAASDQIAQEQATVAPPEPGEDPDEYLTSKVTSLEARLQAYEQREQERIANQEQEQLAARLLQQEMALRHTDPNLREQDFDRIYDLALSHGGDLMAAYKEYSDWKADVVQTYLDQKQTVSDRVDTPAAAPAQPVREVPTDQRGNVDLEAVHRQAMQKLFGAMGVSDSG